MNGYHPQSHRLIDCSLQLGGGEKRSPPQCVCKEITIHTLSTFFSFCCGVGIVFNQRRETIHSLMEPPEQEVAKTDRGRKETGDERSRSNCGNSGEEKEVNIVSWNVNSIRAFVKRLGEDKITAFFSKYDIICLQETKLSEDQVDDFIKDLGDPELQGYFCCSETKKGYSGVVTYTRTTPKNVMLSLPGVQMKEGRFVEVDFGQKLTVINVYIPNSGGVSVPATKLCLFFSL
jgi:hypothetical protein